MKKSRGVRDLDTVENVWTEEDSRRKKAYCLHFAVYYFEEYIKGNVMGGERSMHATELRFVHTFCGTVSRIVTLENLGLGEMKILKFILKK